MKREIKFRGLCVKTNRYEYGDLMYSPASTCHVIVETGNIPPSMQDPCGDTINVYHEVIYETIGQFIGLHDKNGKEIYEGDILKSPGLCIVIEYKANGFVGIYQGLQKDLWSPLENRNYFHWEIAGNIHQNPELLTPTE